jgi:hypothetical protein
VEYHNFTERPSTMKKLLLGALLAASPWLSHAGDINVNFDNVRVQAPGVTVTFGTRDNRGYYWDGYDYRAPKYWKDHNGPRGEKHYTGHGNNGVPHQGGGHCPPGQAKKGNC